MKFILWGSVIFAMILLFPIPLKITLIYDKGIFTLKIFNKTIIPSKDKKSKNKLEVDQEETYKTYANKERSKIKLQDGLDILKFLMDSKVKFTLRSKINIEYSLEDAALNAVTYGLIHQIMTWLYSLLKCFLKVKSFKPDITMKYNENYFKFSSTSIFIVNIAKIIYIIGFIYYQYYKKRDTTTYETSI